MAKDVPTRRQAMQMEGLVARWYARTRTSPSQVEEFRRQAMALTRHLEAGDVLEVAPGPGVLAVELARLGRYQVSALDMSRTMVDMTRDRAREAGVSVNVRQGDAARMPFADDTFDLVVCQAAFKNFGDPLKALGEMHRVLRPGGTAVIQDMNRDATVQAINEQVATSGVRGVNGFMMNRALRALRGRAYSPEEFVRLAGASAFGSCDVTTSGIGMEGRLAKSP